jgi:hypothetical protein
MTLASKRPDDPSVLRELFAAVRDEALSDEQFQQLETLLQQDSRARVHFAKLMRLHVLLEYRFAAASPDREHAGSSSGGETAAAGKTLGIPVVANLPQVGDYLSSGWPVAYLIAAVIVGIGLVVSAFTYVSRPAPIATQSAPVPAGLSPIRAGVGRITGMVDCQFAPDSKTQDLRPKTVVHLGDELAIRSGLLEITYDSGAKVILQGPVTYRVDSADGGYLAVGRLTAKVTKSNDIHHSSFITHHLFSVRTPIALVTDLGTEFGVEVARSGETTSHVFRGSIRVQRAAADGTVQADGRLVRENQTVRVEGAPGVRQIVTLRTFAPSHFVRQIPRRTIQTLDLLDIVAGGYGTTHRRERGIDATTGMEDPAFSAEVRWGNGEYHRVPWHKLIDGVFTPSGGDGPVVVDSAGHTFAGFPPTSRIADSSIWARAASLKPDDRAKDHRYWIYAMGRGERYMPNGLGLLALATNKGITFDLAAIRREYPGVRPARFRATAAVADARGAGFHDGLQVADVWVLVDGQLRLGRRQLRPQDGLVHVDVALGATERFLTLASTWNGSTRNYDWVVLGDPVLDMAAEQSAESGSNGKEVP